MGPIGSREDQLSNLACGIEDQADRLTHAYKMTLTEAWDFFEELAEYCREQARYYHVRAREAGES